MAIARALLCQPDILICDEITSALDVSVQASILQLLQQLQQQGVTILFVTHNLGVVRAIADRVAVLQKGKIVETGNTDQVLSNPKHPYTQLLLAHAPSLFKTPSKTISEQQLSCV
ncbi:putative D,D-dipeptide transport ATP-binding protein DdpF [compost metagenome]